MTDSERTFIPGGQLKPTLMVCGKLPRNKRTRKALEDVAGAALNYLLTEAHVEQTVTQFLELDGWRAIRTDPVSDRGRGKGFGEPGMPDHLYIRYLKFAPPGHYSMSDADVLWIEFKKPGKSAKPHQLDWHEAERARGALVLVIDDINFFVAWYKRSGLARRV